MSFIEFNNVNKEYHVGDVSIKAVDQCNFTIEKGELAVILGPSGAGKTTVLNLLGGMDSPTGGVIRIGDKEIQSYNKKFLARYRRKDIGFVFQFYNLIINLTALENVELACKVAQNPLDAKKVLEEVGLGDRLNNFPSQLSGGEQQRVAIARAISKNPNLLLCDEPTGALDSGTGQKIIALLQKMCLDFGMTTVIITHNAVIADIANRVIKMKNGRASEIIINENPKNANEIVW